MGITNKFRRQHADLVEVINKMTDLLSPWALNEYSATMHSLLLELSGKLKVHLIMEDDVLYPELQKSSNEKVRKIAQQFFDEMGGLKKNFIDYVHHWPNTEAIKNNAEDFVNETRGIFNALGNRIKREDNELYPLYEKIENV
jgi:hemerythrin-like domain-containing protein